MSILTLLIVVPVLTIIGILFTKDLKGARVASAVGMGIQLIVSVVLIFMYLGARKAGVTDEMLFTADITWFKSLNIHYAIGVDGIAVATIDVSPIMATAIPSTPMA